MTMQAFLEWQKIGIQCKTSSPYEKLRLFCTFGAIIFDTLLQV